MSQAANWIFTLNNPQVLDLQLISQACRENKIKMLMAVLEHQEDGLTTHYQGLITFNRSQRLNAVKKILPRCHLEVRKGSQAQAIQYVSKELQEQELNNLTGIAMNISDLSNVDGQNARLIWYGCDDNLKELILSSRTSLTMKNSRKKTLMKMKSMIDEGSKNEDLAEYDFPAFVACYRGLNYYRLIKSKPRNHNTRVVACQGPTGTGKSLWCQTNFLQLS